MSDWKSLATQEANRQSCSVTIVLATIEAETFGRNITGDNGNAIGYGQVWPSWHMDSFEYAGRQLGIPIPSDLPSLTTLVLGNDQLSMIATVYCIKQFWDSAQGDWPRFTYRYVGPAIPASDFARRKAIWDKYQGSNFDNTGSAGIAANSTQSAQSSDTLSQPTTQYGIIPNSTTKSQDILYGRRYRVIVSSLDGEKALDVSQLRCTFNCVKTMQLEPQFSTIVIYNLSPQSENTIITEGFRVTIEAGYEGSQYGLIFDGDVVQTIRNKEDGTTYTLTLVAADSDRWMSYSTLNFSMVRGQNSRAIVENCASKATIPTELGNISDSLSTSKLTRGKVIFGLTRDYIRQIAQSENATAYIEGGKINIVKADDIPEGEILDLSSESGLIGVPAQADYGVTIKCLLNPRIKIDSLVHVDNSLVRAQQFEQGQQVYALDSDGIYKVIQITYSGDTRGNDWYTEVETVTQAGKLPAMIANGKQSSQ